MVKVFAISLGQIAASVLVIILLATENYWAGLAALIGTLAIKIFYERIIRSVVSKNFAETLLSATEATVTFVVISSFGYAGIVYWGIIAPLLLTTYLIVYMGLRIGIATGESAPRATTLENIILPFCLAAILLMAILSPDATIAGWSLANCIGALLLVIFFALTIRRARLAYTNLRTAKP